jgi:hypothetical protein
VKVSGQERNCPLFGVLHRIAAEAVALMRVNFDLVGDRFVLEQGFQFVGVADWNNVIVFTVQD